MNKVLIIAEAGVNHNGDIETAYKLIDVAVEAGVDMVKFQTFKADQLVSKTAKKADYQIQNTSGKDNSQYNMLKQLELSDRDHQSLIDYCNSKGIAFFSTAFDLDGLDYLNSLGFNVFKVPSGEITNYPYLKKLANFAKPVILSTGMSTIDDIKNAVSVLTSGTLSLNEITVLHCNTEYPTPMEDVNLLAMKHIRDEIGTAVGYSDHTLGIEVPIAAVSLGATVIEKHFTLDRSLPGPDHKASLEPDELKSMVVAIRNIEKAISGDGKKGISSSERKNLEVARKSIHTIKALEKGHVLGEDEIVALRPGNGISPMMWKEIIGAKLKTGVAAYHQLTLEDLED